MSKKPTETPVERPLAQPTPEAQSNIQPIIDELKGSPAPEVGEKAPPQGPIHPPQPADHTYPQT